MNLEIREVGKRYKGNVWGIKDFSLDLGPGILGLIGPNGAGKSTLMRILATVTKATTGRVKWDGIDIARSPNRVRKVLGYLPQDFGIYPNLNAVEFLRYLASARGISGRSARERIDQLLELVNMVDARKRPLGALSGGMKQRVGIAQALLNDPKLLIVDEPTAGLDPEERVRFRNLLAELSGDRIVILSSHIVSDVEAAATSIAVIKEGSLQVHAAPEDLLRTVEGKTWEMTIASSELADAKQRFVLSGTVRTRDGVRIRIVADESPGKSAAPLTPTMEDAYLYMLAGKRTEAV
ncbi:MAG: ATP-binding cassette domain-containing protein [Candidatus Latescibacteria bacterium]|nr:ATP-binding cassette domain-containing protein [Candidatus Latescibacterota bacterium]NIO57379.1 ATP-binding cassette domain-containing protein [Candidatus Latescibacterota bacterium]